MESNPHVRMAPSFDHIFQIKSEAEMIGEKSQFSIGSRLILRSVRTSVVTNRREIIKESCILLLAQDIFSTGSSIECDLCSILEGHHDILLAIL